MSTNLTRKEWLETTPENNTTTRKTGYACLEEALNPRESAPKRLNKEGLLEHWWEKAHAWECLFAHRQLGLFLSVYVDDIKMAEETTQSWIHVEKIDETRWSEKALPFLDQVYLGCTQRECKLNKNLAHEYRNMFESLTSAGATEKLPDSGHGSEHITAWSHDMQGHAKTCVGRYCEGAKKTSSSCIQSLHFCTDDHEFKREELETVRELSKVVAFNLSRNACIWSDVESTR